MLRRSSGFLPRSLFTVYRDPLIFSRASYFIVDYSPPSFCHFNLGDFLLRQKPPNRFFLFLFLSSSTLCAPGPLKWCSITLRPFFSATFFFRFFPRLPAAHSPIPHRDLSAIFLYEFVFVTFPPPRPLFRVWCTLQTPVFFSARRSPLSCWFLP